MIVYGSGVTRLDVRDTLAAVRRDLDKPSLQHDARQSVLIELGRLEAAVADALFPDADGLDSRVEALSRLTLDAARLLRGDCTAKQKLCEQLGALRPDEYPVAVDSGVPEGYAFYALYPEMYAKAAADFHRQQRPEQCVVIGIRSIGTSLSAVAAAELEALGSSVLRYSVRPHGHPFDRQLSLHDQLTNELLEHKSASFLIVDEGPGLSGSTLTCVARTLEEIGIDSARIIFMPSWLPEPKHFCQPAARQQWHKHTKYVANFEECILDRGLLGTTSLLDFSGGAWRHYLYANESQFPASHPAHERRKYLRLSDQPVLLKFAGLGRYGKEKHERAAVLAMQGFCLKPIGLESGFLATPFETGRPLQPADASPEFLTRAAEYLAFLSTHFELRERADPRRLLEMMEINTRGSSPELIPELFEPPKVKLDGRMLPQEWILTADGYLKTDSLDHHDDHFFPGAQDIAWDVAGTIVEFDLPLESARDFVCRYLQLRYDRTLWSRLPFYLRAYLAYRIGYATMAIETLGGQDDEARFRKLLDRYQARVLANETSLEPRSFTAS